MVLKEVPAIRAHSPRPYTDTMARPRLERGPCAKGREVEVPPLEERRKREKDTQASEDKSKQSSLETLIDFDMTPMKYIQIYYK